MNEDRLSEKLTAPYQDETEPGDDAPGGASPPDLNRPREEHPPPDPELDPRDPDSAGNENLRSPGED